MFPFSPFFLKKKKEFTIYRNKQTNSLYIYIMVTRHDIYNNMEWNIESEY